MKIRTGELNKRVTIQQYVETADTFGELDRTWSNLVTVWAKVKPISASETYSAQQTGMTVNHEVWIRYRTGIAPKMRVVYGSRTFEIDGVMNLDERGEFLILKCYEVL